MSIARGNSSGASVDVGARQALMRTCAQASEAELEVALAALGDLPAAAELRPVETGLVMLRGRMGGSGPAFNIGEATVTRATVRLDTGTIGFSYLLGRSHRRARLAALVDALGQDAGMAGAIGERTSSLRSWRGEPPRTRACARTRPRPGSTSSHSCAARTEAMPALPAPEPAFRDPVRQSQSVFRLVMEAMASPGRIVALPPGLAPPAPLIGPAAALLLTLCDYETPVWLDDALDEITDVASVPALSHRRQARALAVRCGLRGDRRRRRHAAAVVVCSGHARLSRPVHDPDRAGRDAGATTGGGSRVRASAALPACWRRRCRPISSTRLRVNRAAFPCGVDILFASDSTIAALPRSVRVSEAA